MYELIMCIVAIGISIYVSLIIVLWRENKKILSLILILGFTFWLHNDLDTTQLCYIYSIDHNFVMKNGFKYPFPINVYTGEFKAGMQSKSGTVRPAGRYIATWHDYNRNQSNPVTKPRTLRFRVLEDAKTVILRASKMKPEYN